MRLGLCINRVSNLTFERLTAERVQEYESRAKYNLWWAATTARVRALPSRITVTPAQQDAAVVRCGPDLLHGASFSKTASERGGSKCQMLAAILITGGPLHTLPLCCKSFSLSVAS